MRSRSILSGLNFLLPILACSSFGIAAIAATDCTTKNIDTKQLPPVRDQEDLGWCLSFTAADQFSYALGLPISAADLHASALKAKYASFRLKERRPGEPLNPYVQEMLSRSLADEGLIGAGAIHAGIDNGVCREKDFPSQDYQKSELANRMRAAAGPELNLRLLVQLVETGQRRISEVNNASTACTTGSILGSIFPGYPEERYAETAASSGLPIIASANALSLVCEGKRIPIQGLVNLDEWQRPRARAGEAKEASGREFIDRHLERDELVSLSMDWKDFAGDGDDRHAISIVGRLNIDDECYYRIRNSWGTGAKWKKYCGELSKSKSRDMFCDASEPGYMWMSETVLEKSAMAASALSRKPSAP